MYPKTETLHVFTEKKEGIITELVLHLTKVDLVRLKPLTSVSISNGLIQHNLCCFFHSAALLDIHNQLQDEQSLCG